MTTSKNSSQREQRLAGLLANGRHRIGEVSIHGRFELTHHADVERHDLQLFNTPLAAREIAMFDDAGNFRPLKSAPTLRRGWKLVLRDVQELRAALDFFHPAMLGVLDAHERGNLVAVNLRETLNRQSGMYAVTKKISDSAAGELIGNFCRSNGGCLKTILWKIDSSSPITSLPASKFDPAANQLGDDVPAIPMLCHEACNLLVAEARKKVRSEPSSLIPHSFLQ